MQQAIDNLRALWRMIMLAVLVFLVCCGTTNERVPGSLILSSHWRIHFFGCNGTAPDRRDQAVGSGRAGSARECRECK